MFCINCGKQLEEGSRFCPYCGAKVPGAGDYTQPAAPTDPFAGQSGDAWQQAGQGAGQSENANAYQQPGQDSAGGWQQSGQDSAGGWQQSGQDSAGGWQQSGQNAYQQPGAGAPGGNAGGFDPWAMGGGQNRKGPAPQDDPWGSRGGAAAGAPGQPPKKKKHTLRNVILIVLGVLVLAVIGLYILGSTATAAYEPVIESYLSYAEQGDAQRVESLFQSEYYEDSYVLAFGREEALFYADAWTDNYGQAVERYEITDDEEEEDALEMFNIIYGLNASDYRDVTVDVYYENGRYSCMDFEMVEIDGSWYLTEIW